MKLSLRGLILALSISGSTLAVAGPYVGLSLGTVDGNFEVKNTHDHVDRYTLNNLGLGANFFGGYQQAYDSFNLGLQVNAQMDSVNSRHSVSNEGQSKYSLNYNYGIDLLPGYVLNDKVTLFAMMGLDLGSFKFERTAANDTSFSNSPLLGGYDLGLGSDLKINDQLALRLAYQYAGFNTTTATAGNGFRENITPSYNYYSLGLIYHFA